jgi:hypothetical protein
MSHSDANNRMNVPFSRARMISIADQWLGVGDAQALLRSVVPDVRVIDVITRTGGELSTVYEVRCAGRAMGLVRVDRQRFAAGQHRR